MVFMWPKQAETAETSQKVPKELPDIAVKMLFEIFTFFVILTMRT